MMKRIGETSPRFEARITGAFYLLTTLTGIFAQGFVSGSGRRRIGKETIMSTAVMMERIAGVFYLLIADFKAARI